MSIAGHLSRAMLSRHSHVRMEAKRRALDEIASRRCAADEKRMGKPARRELGLAVTPLEVVKRADQAATVAGCILLLRCGSPNPKSR